MDGPPDAPDLRWSAYDLEDPGPDVLYALVRTSTDGILLIDADRHVVYANPTACEMAGCPLGRLVGRDPLWDLSRWERPSGLTYFDHARRGKLERGTFVIHRPDGSRLDVEGTFSTLEVHGKQLIVIVVRDVSERLRQAREAAALAQAAVSATVGDSIDATVKALAECALRGTRALAAWVSMNDRDDVAARVGAAGLLDGTRESIRAADRAVATYAGFLDALMTHRVLVYPEARRQMESDPRAMRLAEALKPLPWQAAAFAALVSQGDVVGLLTAIYREDELPSEAERTFLATLADNAAIASANARLVTAAQERIAIEERQRLARELHDSIAQDFFGIELGANRARELLEHDPGRAVRPIDYVRELAEAGQAETRALMFELRPDSLQTEGLVASVNRKIEALRARLGVAVQTITGEEPVAPPEVKRALYRIAQEALENTAKHAHARRVTVQLQTQRDTVVLEIEDDGVGFDPDKAFPGHLGLSCMRERALEVGGSFEITSSRGHGTRILTRVPSSARDSEVGEHSVLAAPLAEESRRGEPRRAGGSESQGHNTSTAAPRNRSSVSDPRAGLGP